VAGSRFVLHRMSSGKWLVWDDELGGPARLGGYAIADVPEWRASAAVSVLSRIYRAKTSSSTKARPYVVTAEVDVGV